MHPLTPGLLAAPYAVKVNLLGSVTGNSAGATNWIFSTFNAGGNGLGNETVKKQIVVVAYSKAVSNNNIMTSCTIAGVAATMHCSIANVNLNVNMRIWAAPITATSGNIVITSQTVTDVSISVYEVINANTTPLDNQFIYDATLTQNINTKVGGCVFGAAMTYIATANPTWTWTNMTKDYDTPAALADASMASVRETSNTGALSVTATPAGGTNGAGQRGLILLSFQPLQ